MKIYFSLEDNCKTQNSILHHNFLLKLKHFVKKFKLKELNVWWPSMASCQKKIIVNTNILQSTRSNFMLK